MNSPCSQKGKNPKLTHLARTTRQLLALLTLAIVILLLEGSARAECTTQEQRASWHCVLQESLANKRKSVIEQLNEQTARDSWKLDRDSLLKTPEMLATSFGKVLLLKMATFEACEDLRNPSTFKKYNSLVAFSKLISTCWGISQAVHDRDCKTNPPGKKLPTSREDEVQSAACSCMKLELGSPEQPASDCTSLLNVEPPTHQSHDKIEHQDICDRRNAIINLSDQNKNIKEVFSSLKNPPYDPRAALFTAGLDYSFKIKTKEKEETVNCVNLQTILSSKTTASDKIHCNNGISFKYDDIVKVEYDPVAHKLIPGDNYIFILKATKEEEEKQIDCLNFHIIRKKEVDHIHCKGREPILYRQLKKTLKMPHSAQSSLPSDPPKEDTKRSTKEFLQFGSEPLSPENTYTLKLKKTGLLNLKRKVKCTIEGIGHEKGRIELPYYICKTGEKIEKIHEEDISEYRLESKKK